MKHRFKAGIAALAVGAAAVLTSAPASAATSSTAGCAQAWVFDKTQIQVDKCPGNGATSWVWMYAGTGFSGTIYIYSATIYIVNADAREIHWSVRAGHANYESYYGVSGRVASFHVCETYFTVQFPPLPIYRCSVEVYP